MEAWRRRLWSKRPFWAPCSARSRTTKQRRGGKARLNTPQIVQVSPIGNLPHWTSLRCAGHFDRNREAGCRSRWVGRESTTPELGDWRHSRFIERAGRDFDLMTDAFTVGEGNEERCSAGERRKGEYRAGLRLSGLKPHDAVQQLRANRRGKQWRRPVWKGHLSFGLVSIPVRLYRAGPGLRRSAFANSIECVRWKTMSLNP